MQTIAASSLASPSAQAASAASRAVADPAERAWTPGAPWLYRSEAFAEDLVDEHDVAPCGAPVRVSALVLALTLGVALAGAVFAVIEPLVA